MIRYLTLTLVATQRKRGGVWARERGFHFRNGLLAACGALAALQVGVLISDVARPYQSKSSLRSKQAVLAVARESAPADQWVIFNATERVPHAPYLGDWAGVGGQLPGFAVRQGIGAGFGRSCGWFLSGLCRTCACRTGACSTPVGRTCIGQPVPGL